MTGAEAVVEMLRTHGVEVIFGLCGDTSLPLYDALARQGSMLKNALSSAEPTLVDIVCQPLHEAQAPVSEWVA